VNTIKSRQVFISATAGLELLRASSVPLKIGERRTQTIRLPSHSASPCGEDIRAWQLSITIAILQECTCALLTWYKERPRGCDAERRQPATKEWQ